MINKNNNILITGGAGYIGSHIVEELVKKKNVFILDNLVTGFKRLINKKAVFIKGDIKNINTVKEIIKKNNINSIIHLAAYLNISEAEKNKKKYNQNNITGTFNLIKACKNSSVKNIIFSSSCSIYGDVKGSVSERKKPNPQGYYAFTKYKGEEIIKKYAKKYNYKYAILRYFNVVGASKSGKIGEIEISHNHLFKNIAISSLKKKPIINIFGNNYNTKDGSCIRDYMHVVDLADIHIESLKKINLSKKSIILNCGYGKGISVLQVVKKFQKIIKKKISINYNKPRPGDIAQVYANTLKLKKLINWKPRYNNLEVMLKSAIKWEKKLMNNKNFN
jgi:UDP-glucose 4-epimerase